MKLKFDPKTIKDWITGYLKKHFCNKKRIITFVVVIALLTVNAILGAVTNGIVNGLPEFLLADRWSDDQSMAQVGIYATEDQHIVEEDLKRFEYMLEKKLSEAGITDPDGDEEQIANGPEIIDTIGIDEMNSSGEEESAKLPERTGIQKLFCVAACAQGLVTVSFENRTMDNVNAIGVIGDFFLFHPMDFVSGAPFNPGDLMKDSIVIDEEMAWQLFGSTDIIGQMVTIEGVPHYISGVVKRDTGRIKKSAGLDKSYVYMSYDSLSRYGNILSGITQSKEISEDGTTALEGGINCIEVVCPNPVKGLGALASKESLGIDDAYVAVIDNTDRFSFFSLLSVIRSYGTRSMWNKAIYYPYWENIARGYEDILATILLVRILCVLAVVVLTVISVINAYRNKTWTVRSVIKTLADKKYDLEAEYKLKKEKEQAKGQA